MDFIDEFVTEDMKSVMAKLMDFVQTSEFSNKSTEIETSRVEQKKPEPATRYQILG